jgi:hypothetical protein
MTASYLFYAGLVLRLQFLELKLELLVFLDERLSLIIFLLDVAFGLGESILRHTLVNLLKNVLPHPRDLLALPRILPSQPVIRQSTLSPSRLRLPFDSSILHRALVAVS